MCYVEISPITNISYLLFQLPHILTIGQLLYIFVLRINLHDRYSLIKSNMCLASQYINTKIGLCTDRDYLIKNIFIIIQNAYAGICSKSNHLS